MSSRLRGGVALLSALVAVAASAVVPAAQQSRAVAERPAGIVVDFVAVQSDGRPVPDLQASEIEIRIADRVRAVRALRRVATAPAPVSAANPTILPPFGTNDDVASGRSFAVVIDEASFVVGREAQLRSAVEGLIPDLTPADRLMIVALPFGGVVLPFTSQPARIRVALQRIAGQGNRSETGSELACRTRRFLESFDHFLRTQPPAGSPLTLVLFTGGMAAPRRDSPMAWRLDDASCRSTITAASRPRRASLGRTSTCCSPPTSA